MPFAGTLTKKAHFKRSAAGTIRFSGTAAKLKKMFRTVSGSMGRFNGALSKKAMFKRTVAGNLRMTGAGARTLARFKRTVAGSIGFNGAVSYAAGLARAAYGYLTMTATLTRKVMFKRSASGSIRMNATVAKSIPLRKRLVSGNLYFRGRAVIAAAAVVKRGLNKLGFNIRID